MSPPMSPNNSRDKDAKLATSLDEKIIKSPKDKQKSANDKEIEKSRKEYLKQLQENNTFIKVNSPKIVKKIRSKDQSLQVSLNTCCEAGDIRGVKECIAKGANINGNLATTFKASDLPLGRASIGNHTDIVMYLLLKGAIIDQLDSEGKTVLHHCCSTNEDSAITNGLISLGASKYIRDKKGMNPLDYAKKNFNDRHHRGFDCRNAAVQFEEWSFEKDKKTWNLASNSSIISNY